MTLCQTPCPLSSLQVWQTSWHTTVVTQLKSFLHTSTVCSILILISEEKWWLVQWTAFSSYTHQHWCHDLSFTCIVGLLATKGYKLTETGKVVVPKKQNKQNPSVSWASRQCALWNRTCIAGDISRWTQDWVLSSVGVPVKEIQSNYKYCNINIISNLNMSVCQYW